MSELSPSFQELARMCATCGGTLPCALHDAALREAILRPPEREGLPWQECVRTQEWDYQGSTSVFAVLPDGAFLVGVTRMVRFDPRQRSDVEKKQVLADYHAWIRALVSLPDGTYLIAGEGGRIVQFDPARPLGESEREVMRNAKGVFALTQLSDGTLLIDGDEGSIMRLDPNEPNAAQREKWVGSCGSPIFVMATSPDGSCLVGCVGGDVGHVDTKKSPGDRVEILGNFGENITALTVFPDGTFLIGGQDGRIARFDPAEPAEARLRDVGRLGSQVAGVSVFSDTAFFAADIHGKIARYEIPEHVLRAHRERTLSGPEIPPMPE